MPTGQSEVAPEDIQVLHTTRANVSNAVDELDRLHQYLLWVKSSTPSTNLNVVLKQHPDLPPLRLTWN
jgi:hypothetical protein